MLLTAALTLAQLVAPSTGQAQDANQISVLVEQLNKLREDFDSLQRAYYGGEAPTPQMPLSADETSVALAADEDREEAATRVQAEQAALFEIRLGALEEEIRSVIGALEQLGFGLNQNQQRIEAVAADLEFRLDLIEKQIGDAPAVAIKAPPVTAADPVEVAPGGPAGMAGAQVLGLLKTQPADSAPVSGAVDTQLSPEEQYQLAFSLLQQFRTDEAELAFQAFITSHPDNALAINARYWLGETYYSRKMYAEAARTFFEAYNAAPEGAKAPDNFLKLGMSLAQMDEADNACAVLAELPQRFPNASQEILAQAAGERERLECA